MINHGFFNLNPTFFADFYTQNGFELELFVGCAQESFFEVPAFDRISLPGEASLYVVARKLSDAPIIMADAAEVLGESRSQNPLN